MTGYPHDVPPEFDEDEPWDDDPDMIDSRWSWVAVPFWWTVTAFYWVLDKVFRRNR